VTGEGEDAYGRAILDYYEDGDAFELIERDDGWFGPSGGTASYFAPYPEWPARQREAMDYVAGRVLDVGCGAGRAMAYLEGQGHETVGIDVSPGAVAVCRRRGLDARELDVADVGDLEGEFDTLLMLGNNFGLVGTRERAPDVLDGLAAVASDDAVLLAESRDPTETDDEAHLAYHEFNRERGRMPGALRIRVRYGKHATPWFDYLLASPGEMRELVADTPWHLDEVLGDHDGDYVGVLRR
jgi:SAM-dependent methyltransferase